MEQDSLVTGAPGSIESVYREQYARLWRALLAFGGDPEAASDAATEAFAQALGHGDALRSPADWIWVTAFRIVRGELKIKPVGRVRLTDGTYEIPEPVDHLVAALRRLSERQRLAIVLHDYADRPVKEVASVLGTTTATVYVHLSQGRKRLRSLLGERDG